MGALGPLVGEVVGVERAAIEVTDDGLLHSVRVADTIDFEIEDIVPFGVDSGQPVRFQGMFHPVASDLTMAEARRSRINAFGMLSPWLFAAGYLLTWTGAGLLAYGIGISAHAALGDTLRWDSSGRNIAGATLLLGAAYELTPLKDACQG
jgi:hypothetical protein